MEPRTSFANDRKLSLITRGGVKKGGSVPQVHPAAYLNHLLSRGLDTVTLSIVSRDLAWFSRFWDLYAGAPLSAIAITEADLLNFRAVARAGHRYTAADTDRAIALIHGFSLWAWGADHPLPSPVSTRT